MRYQNAKNITNQLSSTSFHNPQHSKLQRLISNSTPFHSIKLTTPTSESPIKNQPSLHHFSSKHKEKERERGRKREAMAAHKTLATLSLLYLLSFASLSSACFPCGTESPPPPAPTCPRDTLKLGICADVLGGLLNLVIGTPPSSKCCALLDGLVDLEVAVCLCTVIKANVLGIINLDVPVALSLLVNTCGKEVPDGFHCA